LVKVGQSRAQRDQDDYMQDMVVLAAFGEFPKGAGVGRISRAAGLEMRRARRSLKRLVAKGKAQRSKRSYAPV
jgi:DNA-binding IclR family transcriptional regulator